MKPDWDFVAFMATCAVAAVVVAVIATNDIRERAEVRKACIAARGTMDTRSGECVLERCR